MLSVGGDEINIKTKEFTGIICIPKFILISVDPFYNFFYYRTEISSHMKATNIVLVTRADKE
jgi:hypothetical protein